MSINNDLFNETKDFYFLYDCTNDEISDFLFECKRFVSRQNKAIDVIKKIMTAHGKKTLLGQVVLLADIELKIKELQPWERDHVVHALLSYLLGIFFNEKFFQKEIRVNDFQWKLACLFHDVGYPLEMAKDFMNKYSDKLNAIIDAPGRVRFNVIPEGLDTLHNDINSFDLIQDQVNKWNLQINVQEEYQKMLKSKRICHGMISGLSVLLVVDKMYNDYNPKRKFEDIYANVEGDRNSNWNQRYFMEDVVSACSAIFLHNLPSNCFSETKIDRNNAPLPFLLRLSDCLQDWERPSGENRYGFGAEYYNMKINDDKILFQVDIPEQGRKIENDIKSSLIAPDVQIIYKK